MHYDNIIRSFVAEAPVVRRRHHPARLPICLRVRRSLMLSWGALTSPECVDDPMLQVSGAGEAVGGGVPPGRRRSRLVERTQSLGEEKFLMP
jgi:hypothetical protein